MWAGLTSCLAWTGKALQCLIVCRIVLDIKIQFVQYMQFVEDIDMQFVEVKYSEYVASS